MGIINSAVGNQDKQSGQGAADKLNNGLSPNGKATDSDSVIFKVRILVAQLLIPQMKVCGILLVYPREFMIQ